MKIGILTFHWATNYGAVLQAYALQTYLSQVGHDCRIIDYVPYTYKKTLFKCFITRKPNRILPNLFDYIKEIRIDCFRQQHLSLTRNYRSLTELQQDPPDCDVYVCGSDQIWNPFFTEKGEGKPTLSFFLDFGGTQKTKLAYAASFGCTSYPPELINIVKPALLRFDALSVRERTGLTILSDMGIHNASLMPDPTMLLPRKDYEGLMAKSGCATTNSFFVYALHSGQKTIQNIYRHLKTQKSQYIRYAGFNSRSLMGVEEWITAIAGSKGVLTNSFHGVVFSILFKKPFVAVSVEGQNIGMNDRMHTLLGNLGLDKHFVSICDARRVIELLSDPVDWPAVETRLVSIQEEATHFFKKHLVI